MRNLTLCSYITSNIPQSKFERWTKTAEKWGYEYIILGRDETWYTKIDWGRRTRCYVDFLKEREDNDDAIYLFTDSTDVLLAGDPQELVEKFIEFTKNHDTRVVVGGELFPSYRMKNHTYYEHKVVERSFGRYSYPNGGMIMGYKKELLSMYEKISDENCDQLGIMKLIANGDTSIIVDCKAELFANIPYYYIFTHNEVDTWDIKDQRIVSTHGTNPYVIHFPGNKTDYLINKFYNGIMKKNNNSSYHPLELPFILYCSKKYSINILILLLVISSLIILLYFHEIGIRKRYYFPNKKSVSFSL
jgi:hypothetical protein